MLAVCRHAEDKDVLMRDRLILLLLLLLAACGCRTISPGAASAEEEPSEGWLSSLSPTRVRSNVQEALGLGPDQQLARQIYQEGDALFEQASSAQGDERADLFLDAAGKYNTAAARWPDSMLQEDALYMKGECYFFADHYDDARKAFEVLVKEYPNTRHIDRVAARRFDIAQYWLAVHKHNPSFFLMPNWRNEQMPHNDVFGNAVRVYDKIRLDDPTGRLSDDATMAAATAYFAAGKYRQADRFFADLRRTYPESEHQFEAALLAVKAKIELYDGPDYDSAPLEEGQALIELMFEQWPQESNEHREFLTKAYKDIRLQLAQREWETAQFFDGRGEYGGARFYYTRVVQDYADTSLATDAQDRLAAIADRPDKPEQHLEWLVERIPKQNNQHKPLLANPPLDFLRR
jgi:outer membrane protein assembly factor BamD (BamD/ComL family)